MRRLRAAGREDAELQAAVADGRLPTLAVELALGGTGRHTLTQVARQSGLRPAFVRELMQASGRPNPRPREAVFTDEDVAMARVIRRFLDAGLPADGLLEVGRVLSHGMANTAEAVRRLAGDALLRPGDSEFAVGLRYVMALDQVGPLIPELLHHQFRAQLRDGIRGELVTEAEREEGRLAGTREVAVAFADLVDYTRLGERLPAEDLGRIAGRFTRLAMGAARKPVVLVKTIGDAAMFVSTSTPELVDSMVALVEAVDGAGDDFPGVRVGAAYGPATNRAGDWFGATVNLASRVTDSAKPGRVLVTQEIHDTAPGHAWKRWRRRGFKGVDGRVRLFSLEARPDQEIKPADPPAAEA